MPLTVAKRYQLKEYADSEADTNISCQNKITTGSVVVIQICPDYGIPVFGKVMDIESGIDRTMLTCKLFKVSLDPHYHAYEVEYLSDNVKCAQLECLPYYLPVTMATNETGSSFLCIRNTVI